MTKTTRKGHEELKTEPKPLTKLMKHILVDKVENAMVSDRTVDSLKLMKHTLVDKVEKAMVSDRNRRFPVCSRNVRVRVRVFCRN